MKPFEEMTGYLMIRVFKLLKLVPICLAPSCKNKLFGHYLESLQMIFRTHTKLNR